MKKNKVERYEQLSIFDYNYSYDKIGAIKEIYFCVSCWKLTNKVRRPYKEKYWRERYDKAVVNYISKFGKYYEGKRIDTQIQYC